MRDFTSSFDWFMTEFLRIVGSTLDLLISFKFHGVSLLDFILSVALIAFGFEAVLSISKPTEKVKIKKEKKKGDS